jgi:hypothetical protein
MKPYCYVDELWTIIDHKDVESEEDIEGMIPLYKMPKPMTAKQIEKLIDKACPEGAVFSLEDLVKAVERRYGIR